MFIELEKYLRSHLLTDEKKVMHNSFQLHSIRESWCSFISSLGYFDLETDNCLFRICSALDIKKNSECTLESWRE